MQSLKTYKGFRLFLFFRKTFDKKDELFHVHFSRILSIVEVNATNIPSSVP